MVIGELWNFIFDLEVCMIFRIWINEYCLILEILNPRICGYWGASWIIVWTLDSWRSFVPSFFFNINLIWQWLNVVVGIFIVWSHLSTYVHDLITLRRRSITKSKKVARQSADNFWALVYFDQQKYISANKSGQMPRSTGVHAVAGTLYDHFIRFATQHHESFPCYMVHCALGWEEIFRVSGMVWSGEGGFTFGFDHLTQSKTISCIRGNFGMRTNGTHLVI